MNTGQMILSVGAMAILSTVILSMNNSFISAGQDVLRTEIGVTANSLGISIIEEATGKAFDNGTDTTALTSTATLTPAASLGTNSGEVYPNFSDFDDFNNLDITRSVPSSGIFRIKAKVVYIDPASPNVASSTPTWHKKLSITITSPSMEDTLKMDYVFSYFYFR